MQEVQTSSFLGVLPTMARTVWMLGFQRRRVRRWEWLKGMPKPGPLPPTAPGAATKKSRGGGAARGRTTVRGEQARASPPSVLQALDAPAVRRWCAAGLVALTAARGEIDDLNVYPV